MCQWWRHLTPVSPTMGTLFSRSRDGKMRDPGNKVRATNSVRPRTDFWDSTTPIVVVDRFRFIIIYSVTHWNGAIDETFVKLF